MADVKKVTALPPVTAPGIPGFLLWARRDAPALYSALVARFPVVYNFELKLKDDVDPGAFGATDAKTLGDFSDVFSSIGDSLASAGSSIASFVQNNGADLLKLGTAGVVAAQQYKLANAQVQLATMGRPPMQTGYAVNQYGQPQIVPITSTMGSGATSWLPSLPAANAYGAQPNYWVIGGALAGVLGLILLLKKR